MGSQMIKKLIIGVQYQITSSPRSPPRLSLSSLSEGMFGPTLCSARRRGGGSRYLAKMPNKLYRQKSAPGTWNCPNRLLEVTLDLNGLCLFPLAFSKVLKIGIENAGMKSCVIMVSTKAGKTNKVRELATLRRQTKGQRERKRGASHRHICRHNQTLDTFNYEKYHLQKLVFSLVNTVEFEKSTIFELQYDTE